ncbi:ATP-binding protein [Spirosoma soli]|uniref:histidine kinase n=1 Tax=Spirosoma soli TaxID=1770529 RepID=A0ABW5M195_9BACT
MRVYTLLFFLWLGALMTGRAQRGWPPVYEIKTDSGNLVIDTTHFQILEDPEGDYTLEQVQRNSAFRFGAVYNKNRRSHVYWVRMRVKNSLPHDLNLYLCEFNTSYLDMYWLDAKQQWQHQRTGILVPLSEIPDHEGNKERSRLFFRLQPGQKTTIYQRSANAVWQPPIMYLQPQLQTEAYRIKLAYKSLRVDNSWRDYFFKGIMIGILILAVCYNLFIFFSTKDRVFLYFAICLFFFTLDRNGYYVQLSFFADYPYVFRLLYYSFFFLFFTFFIRSIQLFIQPAPELTRLNKATTFLLGLTILVSIIQFLAFGLLPLPANTLGTVIEVLIRVVYILCVIMMVRMIRRDSSDARVALLATAPLFLFWMIALTSSFGVNVSYELWQELLIYIENACFAWMIVFFSGALISRYNSARKRVAQQAIEKEQLEKEREIERNRLIANQNELLERQVNERTAQLQTSLENLRTAQDQLIQKEKLASLGELTAGIAHEIQNPLNFVNNFSEVSTELVTELEEEQEKPDRDSDLEKELLGDLKQNLQKITHHGNRASRIVESMLEHSRTSNGERQPTDLNALCDEYLRLAYHGLRAKDKSFNCQLVTNVEPSSQRLNVVPQEIGRVLLNLFNNAFYAVHQKQKECPDDYQPTVTVKTKYLDNQVEIRVVDNGLGMTEAVQQKIFQPFFTTKPSGEGTGLGLSLSYDIITKGHGGTMHVESEPGKGTEFIIRLPIA